jgi:hypothetical protein
MSNIYAQSKDDDIRTLFKVSGVYANFSSMVWASSLPSLEKLAPNAPLTFWAKMKENIALPSFIEVTITLYDKYYTQSEIEQLITFYKSPIGQKFVKTNGPMTADASKIYREWGKTLGRKIAAELKKEGYK